MLIKNSQIVGRLVAITEVIKSKGIFTDEEIASYLKGALKDENTKPKINIINPDGSEVQPEGTGSNEGDSEHGRPEVLPAASD
jgi:hypothetical protein